jgi:hypothetical protein
MGTSPFLPRASHRSAKGVYSLTRRSEVRLGKRESLVVIWFLISV